MLLGYIDRVRTLQNENHKLYHQVRTFEEYKQTEITNVKDLYDKQVTCSFSIIVLLIEAEKNGRRY